MIITNLSSNSKFQDQYFVAESQLTPFRQLRQIELEIRSIDDALKRASISKRRTELKIAALDEKSDFEALDIEEFKLDLAQQEQMVQDATSRLENFNRLKEELIKNTPSEYWEIGYEAAEKEYWVKYFSRQLALMQITNQPNISVMQQIMLLPEDAQLQIGQNAQVSIAKMASKDAPKVIANS